MLAEGDAGVALPDAKDERTSSSVDIEVCELERSGKIGPIQKVEPRETGFAAETETVKSKVGAQHLRPDQFRRSVFAPILCETSAECATDFFGRSERRSSIALDLFLDRDMHFIHPLSEEAAFPQSYPIRTV